MLKPTVLLVFIEWLTQYLKHLLIMALLITWRIWLFLDFQYSFRSSRSTADFLTADYYQGLLSGTLIGLGLLGLLELWYLIYPRLSKKVWHASLFHKLKSYGVLGRAFGFTVSLLSNSWLWVALFDLKAGKTRLVLFDRSNNSDAVRWNWMGLFLKKNHLIGS